MNKFSNNLFLSITSAVSFFGLFLYMIGLAVAQNRIGTAVFSNFATDWFFFVYFLFVQILMLGAIMMNTLHLMQSAMNHLISIGFVFIVMSFTNLTKYQFSFDVNGVRYSNVSTGEGVAIAGLVFMVFMWLSWIFYFGSTSEMMDMMPKMSMKKSTDAPMAPVAPVEQPAVVQMSQ